MPATQRSRPMASTPARQLRRPDAIRSALLLISWCGAVAALLLLVSGVSGSDIDLATKREILFAGLLVVELAAIYQIGAYRQRRR